MNASFAELDSLAPPSEDGAIGRALCELESKLCAWSDAMTTAHNVLADEFRGTAKDAAPVQRDSDPAVDDTNPANSTAVETIQESEASAGQTNEESPPDTQAESRSENDAIMARLSDAMRHSDHLAREVGVEDASGNPNASEPSSASEATDEEVEEILNSIDAAVAAKLRARHAEAGGKVSMREICDEYFREVAESENLLSTLEPEMAKAIRVQYRLFDGRKTIRQLVNAYEAPKEPTKKKRTWWRG